jgi:hypothetical protein
MFKAGIIDPAKVTRSALQNAASIAGLFLTTEAVIAEKQEKDKAPPRPAPAPTWTSRFRAVSDLLEGITGNSRVQQILICWTTPLLIGAFAFVIIVLPDVRQAAAVSSVVAAVKVLHVNEFLLVFIASLVAAVFLYVNRLPLWRVLEGYTWPPFLRRWRIIRAHAPQCRWLQARHNHERAEFEVSQAEEELEKATANHASEAEIERLQQAVDWAKEVKNTWGENRDAADKWRQTRDRKHKYVTKRLDKLPRRHKPLFTFGRPADALPGRWTLPYPAAPGKILAYPKTSAYLSDIASTQIMPTRLGNAMRVMETYGVNTYGLDSQIMWYELLAEAPESLQATLEQAQLEADTLVCGIYAMVALACSAIAGGAWQVATGTADPKLWITAAISVAVALILYRRLANSVEGWASLVRALGEQHPGPAAREARTANSVITRGREAYVASTDRNPLVRPGCKAGRRTRSV